MIQTQHASTEGSKISENNTSPVAKQQRLAVNTAEACELLGGITPITLWRLEKRGLIKPIRHLRHKLWPVAQLKKFVEEGAK